METLQLSLKTKWFEMTKSGIKTEDYREITPYWTRRLFKIENGEEEVNEIITLAKEGYDVSYMGEWHLYFPKNFEVNKMTLGYPKSTDSSRILQLEHKGIEIRTGNTDWGAEPGKIYFVIKHGNILTKY